MTCEWFYFTISKLANSLTLSLNNITSAYCPSLPAPTLIAVMIGPHPRAYGDFGTLIGFNGCEELKFVSESLSLLFL